MALKVHVKTITIKRNVSVKIKAVESATTRLLSAAPKWINKRQNIARK